MIEIFTDGACRGNPGPGGYGVILRSGEHYKELSGGFKKTTNNRMELMAVIMGLGAIKKEKQPVTIYSDSKYVTEAVEKKWAYAWQAKNYKNKKNADLWKILLALLSRHQVSFKWVKGHDGHPENERCDQLAVAASEGNALPADMGYEKDMQASFI